MKEKAEAVVGVLGRNLNHGKSSQRDDEGETVRDIPETIQVGIA